MWKSAASESICTLCRFTAVPRRNLQQDHLQPWISRRFASRERQRPSRMVLSDRVAQPAAARRDPERKPQRRPVEGPFGGMNRTVANIDPIRRLAQSRSRDRDSDRDRDGGDKKGRKGDRRGFKALKMQKALTTISYGQRTSVKARIQQLESFDRFDLLPSIKEAIASDVLKGMIDVKPTPVQRLAIPALLGQEIGLSSRRSRNKPSSGRQEFLLAAETGSGKTLAYLLPSINAMKKAEAEDADVAAFKKRLEEEKALRNDPSYRGRSTLEPHPHTARPRIVVLVPTAELVDQVGAVSKALSHIVKFKTGLMSANFSAKVIERDLYSHSGVDLVIATPHLLASIAESDPNVLSRVSHLVVDEADSLLDRSFAPVTTKIVDRALPSLRQLVLCSATIPKRLDTYLAAQFPNMTRIATPNLHAIPRRVQLGVIDASKDPYRNNKNLACADAIWSIGKDATRHHEGGDTPSEVDVKRIMVFVNERDKTQEVADYLVSKGIDAVALHRDTPEQRQSEMLASFTSSEPLRSQGQGQGPPARKSLLPNTKVIVATDLASRGIDTLAVRHVVLYDVPHTTIDFIHRLGRAGRMGRRGRGIVLVGKDDRRDVVAEVKQSMFMGQALV